MELSPFATQLRLCVVTDNRTARDLIEDACCPPYTCEHYDLANVAASLDGAPEQLDGLIGAAREADAVVVAWDLLQAPLIGALSHCLLNGATPLVALCGPDEVDHVAALATGADVVLPFQLSPRILKAHVAAHRRHSLALMSARGDGAAVGEGHPEVEVVEVVAAGGGDGATRPLKRRALAAGALVLDLAAVTVRVGDRPLDLAPLEFRVLAFFVEHEGLALTRDQILGGVWGFDFETGTNLVDVYVHALRQALKKAGLERTIHTVRGVGYRFDATAPARRAA